MLNYTTVSEDKNRVNVLIKWTTPDSFKTDMEYQLSVKNDSHTVNQTTRDIHQSLNLTLGVHYTVAVISQRCNGKLQSNLSHPLPLYFKGVVKRELAILFPVLWIHILLFFSAEPPPSIQPENPSTFNTTVRVYVSHSTYSLVPRPSPSSTYACSVGVTLVGLGMLCKCYFGWFFGGRRPGQFFHVMRAATYVLLLQVAILFNGCGFALLQILTSQHFQMPCYDTR